MQPHGPSRLPPPTPAAAEPDPQRFLEDVDSLVASAMGYEATLAGLTRVAVASFASFCIVDVLGEDRASLRRLLVAHRDPRREQRAAGLCRFPPRMDGPGPIARVIRTGKPLLRQLDADDVRSLTVSAEHASLVLDLGIVSSIVVALVARGRTLGAISFCRDASLTPFAEADLPFAQAVSTRIALALDHARLSQSEQGARDRADRASARTQRHLQATAALAGAATSEQVNRVLLASLLDAMEASAGAISIVNERRRELVLRFSTGFDPQLIAEWSRLRLEELSPVCDAVRDREPIFTSSATDPGRPEPDVPAAEPPAGYASAAWLPLVVGDQVLGVATFAFAASRDFDEDERNFVALLAHEGAQALARARLYDSAQAANTAKANFLAVISHELRTPLTAVIGYADLLAAETRGPLNEAQRDQLRRLRRAADQIVGMVEQILDYARVDTAPDLVGSAAFDFAAAAREAIEVVSPLAARKGLTVAARLPDRLDVVTDRAKVLRILLNLLTNAVKFTDRGGVELRISLRGGLVFCEVRDTGIGIAPEHLERVFEHFWQVDQSETRRIGGAGLGLSLARQLARTLGGDIEVESRPGRGSVFTLQIPTGTDPHPPPGV